MLEERLGHLAVARLGELSPALRQRSDAPTQGFCLISGGRQHCRVTIYVENGRGLGTAPGGEARHYEGWLVGPAGVVSLGAFDLGVDGQGIATQVIDASAIQAGRAEKVRVTVEPAGAEAESVAVLEGRLIWLETEAAEAVAEPEVERAGSEVPEPIAVPAQANAARADPAEVDPSVRESAPTALPSRAARLPAGSVAEPVAGPTEGPAAAPVAEPAAGPTAEAAAPAPELRQARQNELVVTLEQRHPMAPRAGGTATINLKQGSLSLALRGLPSPTALGRDRSTDRPFNVYRVWLVNRQTHQRVPVGFCERAWGDNFRFRAEGLPLNRHDTVLVTVEDRTAPGPNYGSPQVLMGSYVQ